MRLLDDSIAEAIQKNKTGWIRTLGRHAATIADHIGDLQRVKHYCEQSLAYAPDDPLTLSSFANTLHRLGEDDLAKQYAAKSYRLSLERSTELDRAIIESLLRTWPDIEE